MSRLPAIALSPVVLVQAARLRRRTPLLAAPRGERTGGRGRLRLVVVGDSTAVGTGVESLDEALPAQLGKVLGARWHVVGRNGATAADVLRDHIAEAVEERADVAVLLVGWNDAMKLRSSRAFARDLGASIERLAAAVPGGRVVVVAPPAFARFRVLPQPLRLALGAHAAGLTAIASRVAAAHEVAFAPGFDGVSVSSDGFHPDRTGYERLAIGVANVLAPSP